MEEMYGTTNAAEEICGRIPTGTQQVKEAIKNKKNYT